MASEEAELPLASQVPDSGRSALPASPLSHKSPLFFFFFVSLADRSEFRSLPPEWVTDSSQEMQLVL